MNITEETALKLSRQLDLLLGRMGLSDNRRRAPIEIVEAAQADIIKFRKKRGLNHDNQTSPA